MMTEVKWTMKRIVVVLVSFALAFCMCGCTSNSEPTENDDVPSVDYSELLTKEIGVDGLSFNIDPSWSATKSDGGLRVDPSSSSVIAAKVYLNGETADISSYIEKVGGMGNSSAQDYVVLKEWENDGIQYTVYERDHMDSTVSPGIETRLFGYSDSGKGFCILFNRGESSLNDVLPNEMVDAILETVVFNPQLANGKSDFQGVDTEYQSPYDTPKASSSDTKKPKESPNVTASQQNALKMAKRYLDVSAFSYVGLIEQLEFEQFSHEDAVYAVENCGADWNEQAAKAAHQYLRISSFSRGGLIDQLEFEGYTAEQAAYGADSVGL